MHSTLITAIFRKLSGEEPSLIKELYDYFVEKYFTPQYGDYNHIELGNSSMISLPMILIAFFIGVNIAAIYAIFNKRVLGDFVRVLNYRDANTPETALTLEELGFHKNTAVRSSLKGVTLRRVVRCVEEEEFLAALEKKRAEFEAARVSGNDGEGESAVKKGIFGPKKPKFREAEFKVDLATAHFYIPESLRYTADIKFEKKGTDWMAYLAVLVITALLVVGIIWIFPDILQLIDNFITMFAGA